MRWLVKIIEAIWPGSVEGLDPTNTRLRAMWSLLNERCHNLQRDNDSLRSETLRLSRAMDHIGRMEQAREDVRTGRRSIPGAFESTFTVPDIGRSVAEQMIEQTRRRVSSQERMMLDRAMLENHGRTVRTRTRADSRHLTFTGPEPEDL